MQKKLRLDTESYEKVTEEVISLVLALTPIWAVFQPTNAIQNRYIFGIIIATKKSDTIIWNRSYGLSQGIFSYSLRHHCRGCHTGYVQLSIHGSILPLTEASSRCYRKSTGISKVGNQWINPTTENISSQTLCSFIVIEIVFYRQVIAIIQIINCLQHELPFSLDVCIVLKKQGLYPQKGPLVNNSSNLF